MMAAAAESSDWNLRETFGRAWSLYKEIESSQANSSSEAYRTQVKDAIKEFERATLLVNELALFSDNEDLEEVPTESTRYLLLPSLLGELHTKVMGQERMESLEKAQVYFRDFLQRCELYGMKIGDKSVLRDRPETSEQSTGLANMAAQRQAKVEAYRRTKANIERLKQLEEMLKRCPDDEEKEREYYLLKLNVDIENSINELRSIAREFEILTYQRKGSDVARPQSKREEKATVVEKELKGPFLILGRNEAQKKVFGAGYPSLPTMTVEEFHEKRYKEQLRKDFEEISHVAEYSHKQDESEDENEDEGKVKEARKWDDFKDTHKRGWGNRQNMG
jgi:immunoglobulin-binding protein 1